MKCVNDDNEADYSWKGNSVCEDCMKKIRERIDAERKLASTYWTST